MIPSDSTVRNEISRRDLEDIATLRKSDAFNRYWLRQLRQKLEAVTHSFKYDEPAKVSKERREELRQQMLVLEELANMMTVHENSIKREMGLP